MPVPKQPTTRAHQSDPTSDEFRDKPWFSGTAKLTGYMQVVRKVLLDIGAGQQVLDIPSGLGQFADMIEADGQVVTRADINGKPGTVYVDMNKPFPFEDGSFDAALCMEGIEHLIDPGQLLGELIRVTKPGGRVVVTTPNIMNFYSRLQFLLTGTFYQFNPATLRDLPPDAQEDRFHISPMSYHRMRYLADYFGADVELVLGDKIKRKVLLPLYVLAHGLGWAWRRRLFFGSKAKHWPERNKAMYTHINSKPALFGRSIIMVFRVRG